MKQFLILLTLIFSINNMAQGRGPAIELGRGLSIDQYDHSKNTNDPGYNWKQSNKGRTVKSTTPLTKNYRRKTSSINSGSILANIAMTAIVVILPIILWFSMLRKVGEESIEESGSVVSMDQFRKTQQPQADHDDHDDHDDNLPKAS